MSTPPELVTEYYGLYRSWYGYMATAAIVLAIMCYAIYAESPTVNQAFLVGVAIFGAAGTYFTYKTARKYMRMAALLREHPGIHMAALLRDGERAYKQDSDVGKLLVDKEKYSQVHAIKSIYNSIAR